MMLINVGNGDVADKLAENLLLSYQCDSGVSSSAVTKIYNNILSLVNCNKYFFFI